MAVMGKPSFSLSILIFLAATLSPLTPPGFISYARYTCVRARGVGLSRPQEPL